MNLKLHKFLFRYRAFPYLMLLPVLFLDNHWLLTDRSIIFGIGPTILLIGVILRLWCIRYIGGAARVKDKAATKRMLVTGGPYGYCRNPIYIANIIMLAGASIMMKLLWMAPVIVITIFLWYHLIIKYEESILQNIYGEDYIRYASDTPRWMPSLKAKRLNMTAEKIELFPWVKMLKYERGGVGNMILVITLSLIKEFLLYP
ncbi:MAG: isoprenylcysteine carboxylmethyltransferase family protein [Planctomycetota bacterium]